MASNSDFQEPIVHLGFGSVLESSDLYRLKSHYFPDGKVGGKPSWLNPINLPSGDDLRCINCSKEMAFLIQLYCPVVDGSTDNFHRTLFVFICRDPNCSKMNDASNIKVFRCQLPRENQFYGKDRIDPDIEVDVSNPCFDEKAYPHLCQICGCSATKKCAKCQDVWYCCRDHQAIDWSLCGHKTNCGKSKPASEDVEITPEAEGKEFELPVKSKAQNPFVFPEYIVDIESENIPKGTREYIMKEAELDADESEDEEDERDLARRMRDLNKVATSGEISANDVEDVEESASSKDKSFQIFQKIVTRYADQIVRYDHGGKPLLATDFAPTPQNIPKCQNCGSDRIFELQLTPHLLSLIDVDRLGHSIDWATVFVFTCSMSCSINNHGYSQEYAFKQDFDLLADDSQPVGQDEEDEQ